MCVVYYIMLYRSPFRSFVFAGGHSAGRVRGLHNQHIQLQNILTLLVYTLLYVPQEMTVPEQSIKWIPGAGASGAAGHLPDSAGTASDRTYVSVPGSQSIDGTGAGEEGDDKGLWESFDAFTTFGVKV